jgi:hypothetical protein
VQHEIAIINGVKVYRATAIARQKLLAATEDPRRNYRTAARDLHDLAFLASKFEADLSADVLADLESFFADQEALLESTPGTKSCLYQPSSFPAGFPLITTPVCSLSFIVTV